MSCPECGAFYDDSGDCACLDPDIDYESELKISSIQLRISCGGVERLWR